MSRRKILKGSCTQAHDDAAPIGDDNNYNKSSRPYIFIADCPAIKFYLLPRVPLPRFVWERGAHVYVIYIKRALISAPAIRAVHVSICSVRYAVVADDFLSVFVRSRSGPHK